MSNSSPIVFDSNPTVNENDGAPNKRRRKRVPLSCSSCRTLKTKCDGSRPVCATCASSGRECVFMQSSASAGAPSGANGTVTVSQNYLRGLENRLEILEKAASVSGMHLASTNRQQPVQQELANSVEVVPPIVVAPSMVVDANLSIGGTAFTQLLLNSFYGYGRVEAQSMETDPESRVEPIQLSREDLFATPDDAVNMLDRYFTNRHMLTPVFHEPSARSVIMKALCCSAGSRHCHPIAFALLNMILALCTSHWMADANANPRTARRHYEIAMALLQPGLLRDWRLEHVQALLLGARYLQTTSCGDECWNVLGLAVRIALGLRLHEEPPSADPPPLQESKRRVWFAAYMLDMQWSMIYGRPTATRSADFSTCLPKDLDDDCIRDGGFLYPNPERSSSMSFFIEMIKLSRIIEKVLPQSFTNTNLLCDNIERILKLDDELEKWHRGLPAHLVMNHVNPTEEQWILILRANMVRILIHRPSLDEAIHSYHDLLNGESMVSQTLQISQNKCLMAAMESVDIVGLRYEQTRQFVGLNWFNIYYLFNAVVVVVSQITQHAGHGGSSPLAKADKALDMIKDMSSDHSFAKRAFTFLQGLLQCIHHSLDSLRSSREGASIAKHSGTAPIPDIPVLSSLEQQTFPDLHVLFEHTREVAYDVQAQLESFECAGSSWMADDVTQ